MLNGHYADLREPSFEALLGAHLLADVVLQEDLLDLGGDEVGVQLAGEGRHLVQAGRGRAPRPRPRPRAREGGWAGGGSSGQQLVSVLRLGEGVQQGGGGGGGGGHGGQVGVAAEPESGHRHQRRVEHRPDQLRQLRQVRHVRQVRPGGWQTR